MRLLDATRPLVSFDQQGGLLVCRRRLGLGERSYEPFSLIHHRIKRATSVKRSPDYIFIIGSFSSRRLCITQRLLQNANGPKPLSSSKSCCSSWLSFLFFVRKKRNKKRSKATGGRFFLVGREILNAYALLRLSSHSELLKRLDIIRNACAFTNESQRETRRWSERVGCGGWGILSDNSAGNLRQCDMPNSCAARILGWNESSVDLPMCGPPPPPTHSLVCIYLRFLLSPLLYIFYILFLPLSLSLFLCALENYLYT